MKNSEKQFLKIHYYFNNDSHSMDALARHKMEKEYLDLFIEIGKTLGCELKLESEARQEGGLIESLSFFVDGFKIGITAAALYFAPTVNKLACYYLTGQYKKDKIEILLQKEKLKQEKLKSYLLENQEIEDREQCIKKLSENPKIRKKLSNFYQEVSKCSKIQKIGYSTNKESETFVQRSEFANFIVEDFDNEYKKAGVTIEIISPVLREARSKWKGVYDGNRIDFTVDDPIFKEDVVNGVHNFQNGSAIICDLKIKEIFDEDNGRILKSMYSVIHVSNVVIGRAIKNKKQKGAGNQKGLFDDLENEDSNNGANL